MKSPLRFVLFLCAASTASAQQPAAPPPRPADPFAAARPSAPAPQSLEEAVAALDQGRSAAFEEVPFEGIIEFHKAEEGKTYASITLGYDPEQVRRLAGDGETPRLFALLRGTSPDALRYDFTLPTDFADSGGKFGGLRIFQTGSAVDPGPYRLSFGVWLASRRLAGGRAMDLTAPDFAAPALSLSTITLAAAVERALAQNAGLKHPFLWGNFKVVPHLVNRLPRQDPLRLYYQIYNASPDPKSGKPRLDITYTFYLKKADRFLQAAPPLPIRNQDSQVQIYELPVEKWPAGEFKAQVQVRDAVAGATVSREVTFELR
jgi:hypothetical protein